MSKIKNVVKVMNFHALLRIDAAKKRADKYFMIDHEIQQMIGTILNNVNFILDKKVFLPDYSKPILTIYFGSDYGFCSNYNSQVADLIKADHQSMKVIFGKKMPKYSDNVILQVSKESFDNDESILMDIIEKGIKNSEYSQINVVYNKYNSLTDIHIEKKNIYPIEVSSDVGTNFYEDFMYEGDINDILNNLLELYLEYQIKICNVNTTAAENILRQNSTSDSLKKMDEREEIELRATRKAKRSKEFGKVIETFSKQRAHR